MLNVFLKLDVLRFLNLKLENIKVLDQERHPHMVSFCNMLVPMSPAVTCVW